MREGYEKVFKLYGSSEDVDLYVGILFEEAINGSQFGPTNQCINADQFIALKKGDKYFYTNKGIFTNAKRTFKGVYNQILSCEEIGGFDFSAWKEEKQETPVDVHNADCYTDPQTVFPVENAKWSCSSVSSKQNVRCRMLCIDGYKPAGPKT